MLGAILGGIGSLIGAFSGGGGSQTVRNEVDYMKMRKSAEAAGFNPLTALRSGGSAGFQVTHTPAMSSAATLARALGGAVQGIADTGVAAETRKQEQELMAAQLELIKARTNAVRSSPSLNVSGVSGSMAGASRQPAGLSTAATAALAGREAEPKKGPMAVSALGAPGAFPPQAAIDALLPGGVLPTRPNMGAAIEPGTTSKDSLEEYAEGVAFTEDMYRTGRYWQREPLALGGAVNEAVRGVYDSVNASVDEGMRRRGGWQGDLYRWLSDEPAPIPRPRDEAVRRLNQPVMGPLW